MRKSLLVLLLAVLLPSVLLGWLALRSAQEQGIVLERRTAELYQKETDGLAVSARSLVSEQRRVFAETVRALLAEEDDPAKLAANFTARLRGRWSQSAIGFSLDGTGRLLSPTTREAAGNAPLQRFLYDNGAFLGNKSAAPAYAVAMDELNRPELSQRSRIARNQTQFNGGNAGESLSQNAAPGKSFAKKAPLSKTELQASFSKKELFALENDPAAHDDVPANARNVAPVVQQPAAPAESQIVGANAEFREFTAEGSEGVVNRFVQDRLNTIFWVRPAGARGLVFGCLLYVEDLRAQWPAVFPPPPAGLRSAAAADPEYILALLDDKAKPVSVSPSEAKAANWKKPFVATEIGEALPHWEAVLYLRRPERLADSVRQVRRNLFLLIACALGAIAAGGWAVAADTRRQLALAQKKTDFVSNVSHELKTPLTSIRMFAEMMHGGRGAPERHAQYLRIIIVEAERLTRLINNVLDFARLERRERRLDLRPLDLREMLERVWPPQEFRLREEGFEARREDDGLPCPVLGDEDALAQVLVNLLSNAEKYGGERREITLRSHGEGTHSCISVLDRGGGVPPGEERNIFQPFYRAHDSLASGIPGTGLGLALARRVVAEHGGEILYQARPGGGSCFTVRLPLAGAATAGHALVPMS